MQVSTVLYASVAAIVSCWLSPISTAGDTSRSQGQIRLRWADDDQAGIIDNLSACVQPAA
jgi:hypothetical protein